MIACVERYKGTKKTGKWRQYVQMSNTSGADKKVDVQYYLRVDKTKTHKLTWNGQTVFYPGTLFGSFYDIYHKTGIGTYPYPKYKIIKCKRGHSYRSVVRARVEGGGWSPWITNGTWKC